MKVSNWKRLPILENVSTVTNKSVLLVSVGKYFVNISLSLSIAHIQSLYFGYDILI